MKVMDLSDLYNVTEDQIQAARGAALLSAPEVEHLREFLKGRSMRYHAAIGDVTIWRFRVALSELGLRRSQCYRLAGELWAHERFARLAFRSTNVGVTLHDAKGEMYVGPICSVGPDEFSIYVQDGTGEAKTFRYDAITNVGHYNRVPVPGGH